MPSSRGARDERPPDTAAHGSRAPRSPTSASSPWTSRRSLSAATFIIGTNVQLLTPTRPIDPELRRGTWEAVELYAAAVRDPVLKTVTQAWTARGRRALERHFDAAAARELDALIEGLVLHGACRPTR
ncbi:hypothetical protein [Actinocorallia aurantiaca]|uniref:Uncharacterized protein n=1 Tax=Actinocorallia aurantiaca TaxID=46204 RepID=A0ABN3UGW3_9ACTN